MPRNPTTGKTDRRALSKTDLLEFRRNQPKEPQAGVKKGKQRAHDSPDEGGSEGSGLSPSPLTALAGLGSLALGSGGSSPADTAVDSPTSSRQPPLVENPAPAPPSAPKNREASQPSRKSASKRPAAAATQHSTGVTVELPGASQLLRPALRQASRSRGDASPASDEGSSLAARIAKLESRLDKVEKWADEFNGRLMQLDM
jgi:hypothetical protein